MSNLMDMPKVTFKNMEDVKQFVAMTKTKFTKYFYELVKNSIKIIGKEQDVYYFDSTSLLWCCVTREVYESAMAVYFDEISDQLNSSFVKFRREINNAGGDEDEKIQKELKEIKATVVAKQKELDSTIYIKTIIERSCGLLQDNKFATKLNSMNDYLPILDGNKISLITGEISERTKNDLFSMESPVRLVTETKHADKFFSQVMPNKDEREYLRKVLGYMLTGNMDARCFFIWYGDGSNGKTVIMKLMKAILQKLYHQTSKGIFMKGSQEKTEGASPDKIALIGVRCATYSEGETSDDIDINESFLKMVSGKDEINARPLFRAPLTFFPICKLNLLTNYKPDLNGDKSIIERIRYLFFNSSFVPNPDKKKINEFKKDDDFIDSLMGEYLSEVFSWILKGSIAYYKDKQITPPKSFQDRTNAFFEQQDSITSFLTNKVSLTDNRKNYIKKSAIFSIYNEYCNDNSLRCHRRSTLFKRLEDLNLQVTTLNGYDIYRGIVLVKHDDIADESTEVENKSVDIALECAKVLHNIKSDVTEIKKRINKMPPIYDDEDDEPVYDEPVEQEKKPTKKKTIDNENEVTKEELDFLKWFDNSTDYSNKWEANLKKAKNIRSKIRKNEENACMFVTSKPTAKLNTQTTKKEMKSIIDLLL
jgi:P4 family phage/plasmid primase-like protien